MFLFKVINEQLVRLYIVPNRRFPKGLPETTVFKTKTKFEIGDIRWFPLKDVNHRSCYNARPFLKDIENFVGRFKKEQLMLLRKFKSRKLSGEKAKDDMDKKEAFVEGFKKEQLMLLRKFNSRKRAKEEKVKDGTDKAATAPPV